MGVLDQCGFNGERETKALLDWVEEEWEGKK
jgi:hypothetical protein